MYKQLRFLTTMLLLAVCCGTWAEEVAYQTLTFPDGNNSKVSAYTATWTASIGDFNWALYNFNNNNNGWSYVKCGRKGTASVGQIETLSLVDKAITKVVVTIDNATTSLVNSTYLEVSTDDKFTNPQRITVDMVSSGDLTYNVTTPSENKYYRLTYDCKSGTSNGIVQISKVVLYYNNEEGSTTSTCATPTFSPAAGTFNEAQDVTISTTTAGATIYYTTDGSAPTTSSNVYSTPINVASTMTINAIAVKEGYDNSEMATATYTIESQSSESSDGTWELTELANLTSTDVFVIVGINGDDNYAMSNDHGTGSAPSAVNVVVSNGKIAGNVADNLKWNVSGNATDGYTFYPNGTTSSWLYCTNTNNGVRVGTNDNKTFKIDAGYLKHVFTSRYVGIYSSQDWRCYTSTEGNIADQTFAFYKYVPADERQEATISFLNENSEAITTLTANINDMVEVSTSCNVENAQLTFESDNEDVASYEDGVVYATGVGTAVITASFAGNETYKPATATLTVTVNENRAESGLAWSANSINVGILSEEGDYMLPTLTNPNNVTVSYSSSNEVVAVVDATGEILLDTSAVGAATITATFAGNNDYKPAEVSYTINIVDNREVPTFAWSESTVEIDLGATEYTLPTLTKPEGATVTYSSSDDEVALVDEATGEVDVETDAVATATITATFAGNKNYKPATASYTINIIDPNAADGTAERPYSVADVISGAATGDVYVKGFIVGSYGSGSKTNFAREGLIASNLALADDPAETEVNNTIAVQMSSGSEIRTALNTQDKPYNIGVAQIIVKGNIEKYITDMGIKSVSDFAKVAEQVCITSAGMSTYYSDTDLDFTSIIDVYAYIAKYENDKVTYKRVKKVPANTGMLLRNPDETAVSRIIPVLTINTDDVTGNMFIGTLEDINALSSGDETKTNYILNNGANGVGFYKANDKKVGAGKAYLQLPTNAAKTFIGFEEEGEATSISTIDNGQLTMENAYNLQGQKVGSEYKGIVIVNGKKFINK